MMRILLLQNTESHYSVLSEMTRDLCAAFLRQGIEAKIFDKWSDGPACFQQELETWQPACTFGINLFAPFANHVCLSVDSFSQIAEHIYPNKSYQGTVLFTDGWSCDLFARQAKKTGWIPHAIAKETLDKAKKRSLSTRRPYDVVLLGSYIDHAHELNIWRTLFSPQDIETLLQLVEKVLENPFLSIQHEVLSLVTKTPALQEALQKASWTLSRFTSSVELYARGLDRKRLLEAFRGQKIHIFGNGWGHLSSTYELHSPVPFSSIFDIIVQAKVVLNSIPTIRRGYHERLFLGLAAGACVVTSQLDVPDAAEAPSLVQYTTDSLSEIQERVSSLKETPPPFAWLENNHTWDVRARWISGIRT